jgi:hypothetical protein
LRTHEETIRKRKNHLTPKLFYFIIASTLERR